MLVTAPGRPARAARGFTLVELCVVMAILALVALFAAPSFRTFLDSMDAKSASMELVTDLAAARTEALKRNAPVTVAPLAGNWTNGWELRVGDDVLGQRHALRPGTWLSAPTAGVTFQPNGRLAAGDDAAAFANVRWSVMSTHSGVQPRCVVIMPTGSARSTKGEC